MKRLTNRILALLLLGIATACSVGSQPVMPVSHDLGPIGIPSGESIPVTLSAPVWLWSERIRYRLLYKDATAIAYYNLDRWEAPLPALLERQLKITAKQQEIQLKMTLTQFEQQFESLKSARVVMAFTVSAFLGDNNRLLGKRSFTLSQPTNSADADGAIEGFAVLTGQANKEITLWLASLADTEGSVREP